MDDLEIPTEFTSKGVEILQKLHELGFHPSKLVRADGVVFTVGQRVRWSGNPAYWSGSPAYAIITEFDPRHGLSDGRTIYIESESGKSRGWVHPKWIQAED